MKYKIIFKESVEKDLRKIPEEKLKVIHRKIHTDIATDPFQGKTLTGKWKGLRRLESYPFRIIYTIFEIKKAVLIIRIRHRKDVYK